MGPRDAPPQFAVPVNADTGMPLSDRQQMHLLLIKEAGEMLYEAMHNAEGSTMPNDGTTNHTFGSRRMAHASTLLETAIMFARKAALETP